MDVSGQNEVRLQSDDFLDFDRRETAYLWFVFGCGGVVTIGGIADQFVAQAKGINDLCVAG